MMAGARAGLHGRARELDAALEIVMRSPIRGPAIVWLEGEAGIGKSRLLAEICSRATDHGYAVARGAATPFEQMRPFAPLLDALDCRRGHADSRRARVAQSAQTVVADLDPFRVTLEPAGVHGAREAIVSLLSDLAMSGPLVVALDDLHWADHATVTTLHEVTSRLKHRPLTLVVTARPDVGRPDLEALRTDPAAPLTTITLGPLAADDIDLLLADEFGAPPSAATRLHFSLAAGHPFLCIALARGLLQEEAVHIDDTGCAALRVSGLPSSLRETVLRRMATMPPELTDLLRYGAVLGPVFEAHDLAVVLGASAAQLAGSLRQAMTSGMIRAEGRRLAFRHALVREVVYDDLAPALRRALHREIATSLHESGASPDLVAAHARIGATTPDDDAASMMVDGAAAIIAHDTAAAIDLLQAAVATAGDGSAEWAKAITDLVVALQWGGRIDDAEAWCHKGLELATEPVTRVALMVRLGWCRGMRSDFDGATAALESASQVPDLPDDVCATLQSEIATIAAWTFRNDVAATAARAALEIGDPAGAIEATVQARCIESFLSVMRGDVTNAVALARDAARRAVALGDALMPSPHLYLGLALVFADDHDGARATIAEGRRRVHDAADFWLLSRYDALDAFAALLAGRFVDSLTIADSLVQLATDTGIRSGFPQAPAVAGIVSLHCGDTAAAHRWLDLAREHQSGPGTEPVGLAFMWWLESALAAHEGDLAAAAEVLTTARELFVPVAPIADFLFGLDLVRYSLAGNDERQSTARVVADALDALAIRMATPTALAIAGVARGLVDDDPERLASALELVRRSRCDLLAARAAEDAGNALMHAGWREQAAASFDEALSRARVLGATLDASRLVRARALAAPATLAVGATDRRPKLTRAEEAVLSLVGEGLDNPQIGEHLSISKRTVESHLAKLYAKLGVTGRVALANEGRRHGARD